MKMVTEKRNILVSDGAETVEFSIKAGAHIMQVLSGLYKDPVDAMVREYLTNMGDAMVALLKVHPEADQTACEIRGPTSLDPTIRFIDYGIGMPLNMVKEVYSQYGNSTKNDDNDETGGFGLGSKTAFCYNVGQTWTIESRYGGQVHKFLAFVNDKNIPSLIHASTEDSTEHSGVTISIPIRRDDIHTINRAIDKYVPFFKWPIKVNGKVPGSLSKVLDGESWFISSNNIFGEKKDPGKYYYRPSRASFVAVMGGVPYPLEGIDSLLSDLSDVVVPSANYTVYITVPVGSLDMVPSRDSLKYTDRTMVGLRKILASYSDGVKVEVRKKVADSKGAWNYVENINTIYSEMFDTRSSMHAQTMKGPLIDDVVTFDGVKIHSKLEFILPWNSSSINGTKLTRPGYTVDYRVKKARRYACIGNARPVITDWKNESIELPVMPVPKGSPRPFVYLIDDVSTGALSLAQAVYRNVYVSSSSNGRANSWGHKNGAVYLIRGAIDHKASSAKKEKFKKDFIEKNKMDDSIVFLLSEIAVSFPGINVKKVVKSKAARKYTLYDVKMGVIHKDVDEEEFSYYFLCNQRVPGGRYEIESNYDNIVRYLSDYYSLQSIKELRRKVVGVRANEKHMIPKKWKDISTVVAGMAEKELNKISDDHILGYLVSQNGSLTSIVEWVRRNKDLIGDAHPFFTTLLEMAKYRGDAADIGRTVGSLGHLFGEDLDKAFRDRSPRYDKLVQDHDDFKEKYGMIQFATGTWMNNTNADILRKYLAS